jgi:hypothetical protein
MLKCSKNFKTIGLLIFFPENWEKEIGETFDHGIFDFNFSSLKLGGKFDHGLIYYLFFLVY